MKIGLYIEHGVGNGVGGAELMMAYLASCWSQAHDVDLVHHRPPLTRERIQAFTTDDLTRVAIRCVPRDPVASPFKDPVRRYRSARDWHTGLSDRYDLFVACTHWLPPFSHAPNGVLLVLFPFYVRPHDTAEMTSLPPWKRTLSRAYHDFEWRQRMGSYGRHIAISEYSQLWTRRRWGIDPQVIWPPVDVSVPAADKRDLVLSIGRFSTMAHTKKQLEMMRLFARLHEAPLARWRYACVGGLNARPENFAYFNDVKKAGAGASTIVEANVDRKHLAELLGSARIFWHATGLDEDTDRHPELAEHFGICTVEAMAAGAVPVVINKGGQPEIVEHGVNGFVWNTAEEMARYTTLLAEDQALWATMSAAARARAQMFSRDRFVRDMSHVCGVRVEATGGPHPSACQSPAAPMPAR
jgi:glycosyltransferase involved in cell wall biosynthesis